MSHPDDRKYIASHEWILIAGDEAVIGVTSFAQAQLGDLTYIELPAVGAVLEAHKEMGVVESVKAASELYSPVNGVVLAVNEALAADPGIVNRDPYGEGWMLKVRVASLPDDLMDAAAYAELAPCDH